MAAFRRISTANDKEMEDFMFISKVRTGHKREFAFALKSQNAIAASLGPTRARKPPIRDNRVQHSPIRRCKRLKKKPIRRLSLGQKKNDEEISSLSDSSSVVMSESDAETRDVADEEWALGRTRKVRRKQKTTGFPGGGGRGDGGAEVEILVVPRKLRDLLQTGFLEGLAVWYRRRVQRKPNSFGTLGVISGCGIRCFCQICKGVAKVVSPSVFEQHAGSRNKRPADFMYMDNGKSIRDVLNACLGCKIEDVEDAIRNACGLKAKKKCLHGSFSALESSKEFPESANEDSEEILEGAYEDPEAFEEIPDEASETTEETPESETEASAETQASYGPPEPVIGKSSDDESCKKLTRKYLRRHKLVFDNDVLADGTELFYYFRGKKWRSGYKQGAGIFCMCCEKQVSPSQFEAHAGWASHRQPYHHIFTSEGTSLLMLAIELSKKQKASIAKKDEVCSICQIEGYSICCSGCPRVFHIECVHLQEVPNDNWYCRCCRYQWYKVVGNSANAKASGGVTGIGSNERRCMRLVESQELDLGGCVLCRSHDFLKEGFGPRTIMMCDQCEREYHVGCLRDYGVQDLKELPQGNWFCCSGCFRINSTLQQLIEEGGRHIPDYLLNIIEAKHAEKDSNDFKLDVKWRLLNGKMSGADYVEQLFSDAVSIFHEQFSPIHIPGSTTDLIPCMVFGKNLEEKDFQGMYCAVLTVNSQVVSAGVFRVYGAEIAELPLVATAKYCEKLGYFQALYSCIENLLGEMEVKHLSLPAANEAKPLWTNKFGFSKFPKDELAEVCKWYPLMPFKGTSMLRKAVPRIKEFSRDELGGDENLSEHIGCE